MTAVTKRLRTYLDVFDKLGVKVSALERTGTTHYKIRVVKDGRSRFFIAPFSPSDGRAFKNFRSDVRRWVKEAH